MVSAWCRRLGATVALGSTLPVPAAWQRARPDLLFLPLVGALLGLLLAFLHGSLAAHLPAAVAGWGTTAAWILLTGGLHLDGLADSADALPGVRTREERLRILHDARVGTWAVAAVALVVVGKALLLAELPPWPLLVALPWARALAVVAAAWTPPHAASRLAVELRPGRAGSLVAVLATLAWCLLVVHLYGVPGDLAALAPAGLLAGLLVPYARRRLGGLGGDALGSLIELGELATLGALLWR